jgi:hypothetical protein
MTTTYEKIATTTLGSSSATITFSSIPATYTDIVLIVAGTVGSLSNVAFQVNSDTGSNYSNTLMLGSGSAATSERGSNLISSPGTVISTGQSVVKLQFMNYSNTTTFKTVLNNGGHAGSYVGAGVGLWRSTSAINSITVLTYNNNSTYQSGSTFTLYGIKAE